MHKFSSGKVPTQIFVGNALGAFTLAMNDKIEAAVVTATRMSTSACSAIVTIGSEPKSSIEELRRMLGLEHSSVVRLIDRLERGGYAERLRSDTGDRRQVKILLTDQGEDQFTKILDARSKVLSQATEQLSESELKTLENLINKIVPVVADKGDDQHVVCRLCDLEVCEQERCPVNHAYADNVEIPLQPFRRTQDSKFA